MRKAEIYSLTIFCPAMSDTVHVPFYDCVRINPDGRIQVYCLLCKENHIIDVKETKR